MVNTCYYKIFCKNTSFVVIFPFVMENNLFAIISDPKFPSIIFFPCGVIHAQGVDIQPVKIYGFQEKFSKNG